MKDKVLAQIEEFMNDDESFNVKAINTQIIVEIADDSGGKCKQAFTFDCTGKYIDNSEVK